MRTVKLIVSLLVFMADKVAHGLCRLAGGKVPPRCVVLYYHSVMDGQRERFAQQMDVLLRHAHPMNATASLELHTNAYYVGITFDDANANIIANALPALKARNIPVIIFVISDRLGVIPDWENFGPDYTADERIMTAEQLTRLPSPLISIGSHTMTHPILTKLEETLAKQELLNSRLKLESWLGQPVRTFSFPYGAYNEQLISWCREAGYERIFTSEPGLAFNQPDEFVVDRIAAEPTDNLLEFRLKIAGAYRWLKPAARLKRSIRRALGSAGATDATTGRRTHDPDSGVQHRRSAQTIGVRGVV